MSVVTVGKLVFRFDNTWSVTQYDEWHFYKNKFQQMCGGGTKAVDILAIDTEKTAWLIEVKDYREHSRAKAIELPNEVARKVFDTLAGLLPARVGADEKHETHFAGSMHKSDRLRIVLHIEQPKKHSKLFPRAIRIADVQQKLQSLVKPVDAHPVVCESANLNRVPWAVASAKAAGR